MELVALYLAVKFVFAAAFVSLLRHLGGLDRAHQQRAMVLAVTVIVTWPSVIALAVAWQHPGARAWITNFILNGEV